MVTRMWEFKHPSFRADREDLVCFVRRQGQKVLKKFVPDYEKRRSTRIRKKSDKGEQFDFADSESQSEFEEDENYSITLKKETDTSPPKTFRKRSSKTYKEINSPFSENFRNLEIKTEKESDPTSSRNIKNSNHKNDNISPGKNSPFNIQSNSYEPGSIFSSETYRELGIRRNIFSFSDKENAFQSSKENGPQEVSRVCKEKRKRGRPRRSQNPSKSLTSNAHLPFSIGEDNFPYQYSKKIKLEQAIANDPFMNGRNTIPPITDDVAENNVRTVNVENDCYIKLKKSCKRIFESASGEGNRSTFSNYGLRLVQDDEKRSLIQGFDNKIYLQLDRSDNLYELTIEGGKIFMNTNMINCAQNSLASPNTTKMDHCYFSTKSPSQFQCEDNQLIHLKSNAHYKDGSNSHNGHNLQRQESDCNPNNFFDNGTNDANFVRKSVITSLSEALSPISTNIYSLYPSSSTEAPFSASEFSNLVENSELEKYYAGTTVSELYSGSSFSKDAYNTKQFNEDREFNIDNYTISMIEQDLKAISEHFENKANVFNGNDFNSYYKPPHIDNLYNTTMGANFCDTYNDGTLTKINKDDFKHIAQEQNSINQYTSNRENFNINLQPHPISHNLSSDYRNNVIKVPGKDINLMKSTQEFIHKNVSPSNVNPDSIPAIKENAVVNCVTSKNEGANNYTDDKYLLHNQKQRSNNFSKDTQAMQELISLKSNSIDQHCVAEPSPKSMLFPHHHKRDTLICNEVLSNSSTSSVTQQSGLNEHCKNQGKDLRVVALKFLQDQIDKDVKFEWKIMNGQLIIEGCEFEITDGIENWIKEKY